MVKGISRQVIVVRPPDTRLFDEAIFVLRDHAAGVTDEQILEQAQRAADDYLRSRSHRAAGVCLRTLLHMLLGAVLGAVPWLIWLAVR